jgi:hypothetical protein
MAASNTRSVAAVAAMLVIARHSRTVTIPDDGTAKAPEATGWRPDTP